MTTDKFGAHDYQIEAAMRPTDLQKKHVGTIAERLYVSINLLLKEHQVLPQDFRFENQVIADEAHSYMVLNPARDEAEKAREQAAANRSPFSRSKEDMKLDEPDF